MGGQAGILALGLALALGMAPAAGAQEQAAPFLFLSQERILTGSTAGQRLLDEEEAERDALRSEARKIDEAFEAEEQRLTDQRATLPQDEFRKLADDFDARVIEARRQQDTRAEALALEFDRRRRAFYARVAPILVELMDRYGAKAIFDESSVLLADQGLNITGAVIAEIDAREPEPPPREAPAEAPSEQEAPGGETDGGG